MLLLTTVIAKFFFIRTRVIENFIYNENVCFELPRNMKTLDTHRTN